MTGAIRPRHRRNHRSVRNAVEMTASDASRDNSKPFSNDRLRNNNVSLNNNSSVNNVRINGVEMISNDKPSRNNGRLRNNNALNNNARRNENEARSSVRTYGAETTSSDVVMNSAKIRNGRRRNVNAWNWSVRGSNRISDRICGVETISDAQTLDARGSLTNNAAKLSDSELANKDRNPIAGVDRDNATIQTGNVDNRMC